MRLTVFAAFVLGMVTTFSSIAADQTGAEKQKRPVSAKVIAMTKADNAEEIGNIEVTYADGTKDRWTTKGDAGLPQVAADGSVGWTVYAPAPKGVASTTLRANGTLVVSRQGQVLCRAKSALGYIEEWSFLEDGAKFVLKTRGSHGPAFVELHETKTGKLLESVRAYEGKLPKWAEPFKE